LKHFAPLGPSTIVVTGLVPATPDYFCFVTKDAGQIPAARR
jgi:hypothetical protein